MDRRTARRLLAAAALLLLSGAALFAQTSPAPAGGELDGLFTDNESSSSTAKSAPGSEPATPPALRPDDPTQDRRLHYYGSVDVYGLLGIGWPQIPDVHNLSNGLGNEVNGSFTASLGFDVRPATELRIRGSLSYSFPASTSQFSEFIVDYSVKQAVFFTMGTFGYTWGNSQFFQFSNLPYRSLSGWGINNQPIWQKANIITTPTLVVQPVSVEMSVPFGLDSIKFLARFDMQNYGFPSPTTPDPRDAGYGVQASVVTGPIEWTLGGFWQWQLTPRTSLSLKTSFLGFDFSAETTVALPLTLTLNSGVTAIPTSGGGIYVGGMMQRIYPTFVLGLSREWTDARIKLYFEYAFNGERDPGISWLADNSGPGGHNTAAVVRFANLGESGISLNVLWQHNWSDASGLISPLLEVSPVPLTTIQFGPVLVYGPDGSETMSNRIVPGGKRLEMLLLVKVSTSYRQ